MLIVLHKTRAPIGISQIFALMIHLHHVLNVQPENKKSEIWTRHVNMGSATRRS